MRYGEGTVHRLCVLRCWYGCVVYYQPRIPLCELVSGHEAIGGREDRREQRTDHREEQLEGDEAAGHHGQLSGFHHSPGGAEGRGGLEPHVGRPSLGQRNTLIEGRKIKNMKKRDI